MAIKTKNANFGNRSYTLLYGSGAVNDLEKQLAALKLEPSKLIIVSHPEIRVLFENKILGIFKNSDRKIHWVLIPSGEKNKNPETVEKLYLEFSNLKVNKNTPVIALGGGVLQDLVNFTTATFLRGVPFIQIPTTLLSQADIGIGGCAVDHPMGKSLIGTFYQPKAAILDPDFLSTLSDDEIRNGISEIINKVVCLGGKDLFELKEIIPKLLTHDSEALSQYILESNAIKLSIIESDETGILGKRFVLDFGHTLTYAIEKASDYSIPHGFALGIGMHAALILSQEKAGLSSGTKAAIISLIEQAGLPLYIPHDLTPEKLLSLMHVDQKVKDGMVRFILISDIGKSYLSDSIQDKELLKLMGQLYK
jgi:3-dehydroquinate synthase